MKASISSSNTPNVTKTQTQDCHDGNSHYLLKLCRPLLRFYNRLLRANAVKDKQKVFLYITNELAILERQLKQNDYHPTEIQAVIYCLCAALDEVLCQKTWKDEESWQSWCLLQSRYNDPNGGEQFYHLLDDMLRMPDIYSESIECLYYLLCLGYEGMHHSNKQHLREDLLEKILLCIKTVNPDFDNNESMPIQAKSKPLNDIEIRKYKRLSIQYGVVLFFLWALMNIALNPTIQPTLDQLNSLTHTISK